MRWELDWIENRARLTPTAEAIVDVEQKRSWTFSEVNKRSMATASWLKKQGVSKGDRVALLSPNHISYFDLLFACVKLGAIFVPINWRLAADEMDYILQDCTPKVIGYHSCFSEKMNELVLFPSMRFKIDDEVYLDQVNSLHVETELTEQDPLAIIYTGGTTGKPKGVVLSHQSIMSNGLNTILSWNLTKEDTTLTYMPLFHTGGLNALSIPLLMIGGKVIIASMFKPVEAIRYLNDYKCTIVLFVPTMYHMIVHATEFKKQAFPTVKTFLSGGAPCPLEIYEEFQRKGLEFKEGYGLTEAGPNNFYMDQSKVNEKRGSVGKPMLFNDVRIMREDGTEAGSDEVGELWIKGKHTFKCYWNNREATAETMSDGWLRTGDLAKKDTDGYYYIVGRKKDLIITGGENVYPLEVEHWISNLPQVDEVAVVGIPDRKWGETVTAFIVLKENGSLTLSDLMQHCSIKLGNYKIPKEIIFLEELPKTHVGKINKEELKKLGAKCF
ncbi:long-chain fatty acid--CoA ligase [Bacillus sp. V3B]|uniref:acyl-CoA synthetase n=1 Tax=Bacillus sp. V3B TaxID=2804915 RepID=UPI00210E5041|nr:long-chain fatty acid--CoA ligase [Bacillus sp. V3B]MCQ6275243.1 long-chain fatty acid--CoA ligase [Bacillus sp. V3B]